ncbi:DUF397 domain-containing protein [Streptomyces sp. NPDC001792]|uniref:DUF397 domain-containing protein n=1 Tax=Streptomyces sp. NPDC001792 TaxID=3154524 RepID=UPI00332248C8
MTADRQSDTNLSWFKSSYSGGNATECVEAAFALTDVVIRDSKHTGPVVTVRGPAWHAFLAYLRKDQRKG